MNQVDATNSIELAASQPVGDAQHAGNVVDLAAPVATPAKPKKKRAPRPTFEDGALTRVFKFPSKKFPKSSYYVTDTEIIIRIRKARKKWKLILAKKQVVSCRTNRWFTKPRWIEIELTYTQAVRQGLHEPTAQPVRQEAPLLPEATQLAQAAESIPAMLPASDAPMAVEAESAAEIVAAGDNETDAEIDAEFGADEVAGWVPDDDGDASASEEPADTDDEFQGDDATGEVGEFNSIEIAAGADEGAEVAPAAQIEPIADLAQAPVEDEVVTTPEAAFEAPAEIALATIFDRPIGEPVAASTEVAPIEAVAAAAAFSPIEYTSPRALPKRVPPKRRYLEAQLLAATLALAILSLSADRSRMADGIADNGSCAQAPNATCDDQAIVTGSIDVAAIAGAVEAESPDATNRETQPARVSGPADMAETVSATAAATIATEEPAFNQSTPIAATHAPTEDAAHRGVVVAMKSEATVSVPLTAPSQPEPAVVSAAPETSQPPVPSAEKERCQIRSVSIAKSTVVQFGYASATLPALGVEPLDALASTLRQCPAVHVMIEGHTDSDGDYYRNQSLSVRRASAVRQHLVNAGAGPAQLSIIGFGQIRPLAPNDTATNKSRNRRIELVVQ